MPRLSHVIAFHDAPFGVVFAGSRLDGVVRSKVRRDGANAARVMGHVIAHCRFAEHLQLIMLQGIAVAGFNVVDVFKLQEVTALPMLVVARKEPDYDAIRAALQTRVPAGHRKWRILERLGPMEKVRGVYVQRVGLTREQADAVVARFAINGNYPEPLRVVHLIASAARF